MSDDAWLDQFDAALREHEGEEHPSDAFIALALIAGQGIEIDEDELQGAVKRALLVLAAGGDPTRGIDLAGRGIETIAEDLDSPVRRKLLMEGLESIRLRAVQRDALHEVIVALEADPETAWRAFSAARMVELLGQGQDA
jgi:hypothetical protein